MTPPAKPRVMVTTTPRPMVLPPLGEQFEVLRYDLSDDGPGFLAEHGPGTRALLTTGHFTVDEAVLAHLPDLELVSCTSAGYEGIDLAALAAHGVALTNTSQALCDDVADMAVLLILAARRGFVAAEAYLRSGSWERDGEFPLQTSLSGKRAGIVGMGTIGQAIATRLAAMNMQVSYWNRRPRDVPYPFEPDLLRLATEVDTLVVIVAGGEGTRGLISAEVIHALGPTGLLVNVARGSVIDEAAMIAALESGALGGAGLDVFSDEPRVDPRLRAMPHVALSPHHASGTVETRDAMALLGLKNLEAHFAGRPLLTPVSLPAA
jgi:lactate dehydrogenase-like 2-hydroxyacid dehydrogenase